ncbi:hypothetical protein PsorP6_011976 [Peronosclerospora sorghi]|uniref:Uncharacterized protein n=1 Tax=Peronosclerospora sorghi TaxID=230839 RepID=A0ACC0WIK5_9STRA|nr:hypothetical protein PsorP6_011976 [Peronosclerospora sorghi]
MMVLSDEDRRRTEEYFRETSPPKWMNACRKQVEEFLDHHRIVGKCVAVVTSGGTTVPLERNTVRFVDNCSTGFRGAASVEYLLGLGYAVIYMHRPGTLLTRPFTSVDDYFYLLRLVATCVEPCKNRALFLLAAAVSDFYVPRQDLSEHKISRELVRSS